jgi:hypothetical protein
VLDGSKAFPANALLGDLGKPAFDLIEPGGACWGKMQMIAGSASKPLMHLWRLVSAVVIQNQMDVERSRDLPIALSQKAQEFLMAVLAVTFADDFARGDIQGGKE